MTIPTINLSLLPVFPAKVIGQAPIVVAKAGLNYTLSWDITKYSVNPTPGASEIQFLGYNVSTNATERFPAASIRDAAGLGDLAVLDVGAGLEANAGALRIAATGVTAGAYTNPNITVGSDGRVASISNGSVVGGPSGQCRLVKSGSNIVLQPFSGNLLTINGANQVIPSSGVSLAATGLTPSTLYYIYAYMNSGTMTLEPSATGFSIDATTGMPTKTGDATRTLVGMARPITGPAWQDTSAQRFVLSYFNRKGLALFARLSSNATTASTTYVELSTALRVEFLTWADENASVQAGSWSSNSSAGASNYLCVAVDGSVPSTGGRQTAGTAQAAAAATPTMASFIAPLAVGYHYFTLMGRVSAGTLTIGGTALDDGNSNYTVGQVVG